MGKLITCKDCGKEVSKQAKKCPTCGAPVKRKPVGCLGAIFIVAAVAFIGVLLMPGDPALVNQTTVARTPAKPGDQWQYLQNEDQMTGNRVSQASVSSSNFVEFDSPYSGAQRGKLILRTHPQHGKDVIFRIERGQVLCQSYEECEIEVRFGESQPVTLKAIGPTDNSSESVFIRDYHSFVEKMLKVEMVRIQVPVFQEGNPVFEFDVSHFDQSKYLPAQE